MNNLKKIFILLAVIVLLGGCSMKANYNVGINSDNSMNIKALILFDDELIEALASTGKYSNVTSSILTEEVKWEIINNVITLDGATPSSKGFKVKRYEKDNFKGLVLTKTIKDIDKLSGDESSFNFNNLINIENYTLFEKKDNVYSANWSLEKPLETINNPVNVDSKLVITLPKKPVSNNATSVSKDGKTLTWNLSNMDGKNIEFSYEKPSMFLIFVIIGIFLFIALIVVIVFTIKKMEEIAPVKEEKYDERIKPIETLENPDIAVETLFLDDEKSSKEEIEVLDLNEK